MLDIHFIRDNPKKVVDGAKAKGVTVDIDALLELDEERRKLIAEVESKRHEQKTAGERMASEKDPDAKKRALDDLRTLKESYKMLSEELKKLDEKYIDMMRLIPNLPRPDVKFGKDESDNEVLRTVGEPPKFDFEPKDHLELGEQHGIIDTERAAKTSGARFGFIKGDLALMEFALMQYTLQTLIPKGFIPVIPPVLVKPDIMGAMGYMDRHDDEIFTMRDDELVLVGTSEQSIGPMHIDETLKAENLPLRYVAFSACFRREAGSYGKDTKGILRVHQFNKMEMFSFTTPETSEEEHEFLLECEEELMKGLDLPYQVIRQSTGDMGTPSARTYDIETWLPSQAKYRETHSTSTTTDFQSRRLNIGYRNPETQKRELVHMLNGTAFSERLLIAIIENNQQADGSIDIPDVLVPHMAGKTKIG